MSQASRAAFTSPPFFSALWVGRHPADRRPRLVHCFGPSEPDDFAAVHAAVLGLGSLLLNRDAPLLSRVWGELDQQCLVVHVHGYDGRACEVFRTGPLPDSLVNVVRWRPEVLLLWVDVPLRDPLVQLGSVGLQHVWTGVAPIRETGGFEPAHERVAATGERGDPSNEPVTRQEKGVHDGTTGTP